jgi:hypothetical protein
VRKRKKKKRMKRKIKKHRMTVDYKLRLKD